MRWFTADTHFCHRNIIRHCDRPFKSVDQMNEVLIKNWNKYVTYEDEVFILGDFIWGSPSSNQKHESIISRLNGHKHLILGNHDELKPFRYVELGICTVHTALDIGSFILTHDPAVAEVAKDRKWLCGHVHHLFKECRNVQNVGVDVNDFRPVMEEELY